jgi:hypothetical protein
VFEPYSFDEKDPGKYSCELIFEEGTDLSALKAAAKIAAEEFFGKGKVPKNIRTPFRDGADREQEAYEGCTFIGARSKDQPGVVMGPNREEVIDKNEVYSGCYCRLSVTAFGYDHKGNKGVTFALNHVWKVEDGEPFGNRSDAADEFSGYSDDTDGEDLL